MIQSIREGKSFVQISKEHYCSDSNIIKAVNSSLNKAWKYAKQNGGNPYPVRTWKRSDLVNPEMRVELVFLLEILKEHEVKLTELLK
jgi:hypothetical protein